MFIPHLDEIKYEKKKITFKIKLKNSMFFSINK